MWMILLPQCFLIGYCKYDKLLLAVNYKPQKNYCIPCTLFFVLPSPDTILASCFWCWASVLTVLFQPDWKAVLCLHQPKKHCFFFLLSFQDFFPFSGYLKYFVQIKSSVSLPPFSLWSCIWTSLDKIRRLDSSSVSVLVPGIKLEGKIDLTCLEKNYFKVFLMREMKLLSEWLLKRNYPDGCS